MTDKVRSLLEKIRELAVRGEGGERTSAELTLKKLCKKYEVDYEAFIDELNVHEEVRQYGNIHITQETHFLLFCQIVRSLHKDIDVRKFNGKKYKYCVVCTQSEYLEIMAKYEFYYPLMIKEQERATTAFILVNKLTGPPSNTPARDQTAEERRESRRLAAMMANMDATPFHKQLTN